MIYALEIEWSTSHAESKVFISDTEQTQEKNSYECQEDMIESYWRTTLV